MHVFNGTAGLVTYRAFSDIVAKIAFLGVMVLAARRLPGEAFGIFALGSTLGWMVSVASDFGMQLHLSRSVAQQPDLAGPLFRRWWRVRASTCAVALLTVAAGVTLTDAAGSHGLAILLLGLAYGLGGLVEFVNYLYRALSRSHIESSLTLAQRLGALLCAAGALWWRPDVTTLAAGLVVPNLLALVWSLRTAARLVEATPAGAGPGSRLAPGATGSVPRWSPGEVLPIGAGILFSALYFRIDIFLIEMWSGTVDVGLYNAVFRVVEALRLFPAAAIAVSMPTLFRATNPKPLLRSAGGLTLFGLVVTIVLSLAAGPLIVGVYGLRFGAAVPAFRVLLLAFPLMSLNYGLTHQLIGWHGHRAYATICLLALVFNVSLNAWLIPAFSILGAAWTTVLTEMLMTVGCGVALAQVRPIQGSRWAGFEGRV